MVTFIVVMVVVGLVAGFVARAVVPGRQRMGLGETILLGVVGSFVGGFLGYVLFHHDVNQGALQPSGFIGSIIGAILVLLIWKEVHHGQRRTRSTGRRTRVRGYTRRT